MNLIYITGSSSGLGKALAELLLEDNNNVVGIARRETIQHERYTHYAIDLKEVINENIFQKVLPQFEGSGQTVAYYMKPAYYWLGWGIKGPRQTYAYEFTKKLQWT